MALKTDSHQEKSMKAPYTSQDQHTSIRVALWAALIAVHSVFLASACAVVLTTKSYPLLLLNLLAISALIGAILALLCIASIIAHNDIAARPSRNKITLWWSKSRLSIIVIAEATSVILLLVCALIIYLSIF